ncbi:MAG TPA: Hsp20/alpha crystallin family protein [Acidimicrobiales bacterium]|nr:Hsp20/alpha crystallin family protein [Acidimicrobiales bacterium]
MFEPDVPCYVQPLADEADGVSPARRPPLAYDAYLARGALHLEFDVPGVPRDRLRVRLESHVLVVEAERVLAEGARIDPLISGRPHGSARRRLLLGDACDVDRLEASLEAGVLSIRVPLVRSRPTRQVPVREPSATPPAPRERVPAGEVPSGA